MCISGLIFGDDSAVDENSLDFGDNLPEAMTQEEKDIRAIQAANGYPMKDNRSSETSSLDAVTAGDDLPPGVEATVALVGDLIGV